MMPSLNSIPLVCFPDDATAIVIDVAKTKTACRLHPMLFFTPSTIHILEIVILFDELLRDVLTGLKVNALPGTDTAIDILERLWIEDGHGGPFLFLARQMSTMDASKADSRDRPCSTLVIVIVNGKDLEEI